MQLPLQALLHFVLAQWLTMCEYIRARLSQIEWEPSHPKLFLMRDDMIGIAFNKLHVWRRLVPIFQEILNENLHNISTYDVLVRQQVDQGLQPLSLGWELWHHVRV